MTLPRPLRLVLCGASPDTGNLGVSALCYGVLTGIFRCHPDAQVTVFDEGHGLREATTEFDHTTFHYALCGASRTRRIWQRRSYWNIRVSNWFGGLGNPAVHSLHHADAVLDITGGDSFTDMYGSRRFRAGSAFKQFVLNLGKPLILLPQTYGPYRDPRHRGIAADICRRATMCWARDERSFATLKDLLGDAFDPLRHRSGVDVAFALEARTPRSPVPEPIATWLRDREPIRVASGEALHGAGSPVGSAGAQPLSTRAPALIGLNVSGLIWHDPVAMRDRYGFKADYRAVVVGCLRRLLLETDANVLLIPHVLTPPGHYESDPAANEAVIAALRDDSDSRVRAAAAERLAAVPPLYDHPCEVKWLIAHCDWFCGTRMHACIAALSSGVPTAAIAYSVKTQGVFETCGVGHCVVDPRVLDTPVAVEALWAAWSARAAAGEALRARIGAVRAEAAAPFHALGATPASSPASALPGIPS